MIETKLTPFVGEYADMLPPQSSSEFEALKSDIAQHGVLVPIVVDETGAILDGHHRFKCDPDAPFRVVSGLSDEEKQAFSIRCNLTRRNLSPDQKRELLAKQKALAARLRKSDPQKWTQQAVGQLLGVDQSTVARWFSNNMQENKATRLELDARVKLHPEAKKVIAERAKNGERQTQIAADFGVSQKTVSNVVREVSPEDDAENDEWEDVDYDDDAFDEVKATWRIRDAVAKEIEKWPDDMRDQAAHWAMSVLKERGLDEPKPHVANNNGNNEWYTPREYVELARQVMRGIDLDPASTDIANQTVQAERYYTKADDGLTQPWAGKVWMNPPYAQPLIGQFCQKLADEVENENVSQAFVLVNNATETEWFGRLAEKASAILFPRGRVKFTDPDGKPGAPLQGQALIYIGPESERFADSSNDVGICWRK